MEDIFLWSGWSPWHPPTNCLWGIRSKFTRPLRIGNLVVCQNITDYLILYIIPMATESNDIGLRKTPQTAIQHSFHKLAACPWYECNQWLVPDPLDGSSGWKHCHQRLLQCTEIISLWTWSRPYITVVSRFVASSWLEPQPLITVVKFLIKHLASERKMCVSPSQGVRVWLLCTVFWASFAVSLPDLAESCSKWWMNWLACYF